MRIHHDHMVEDCLQVHGLVPKDIYFWVSSDHIAVVKVPKYSPKFTCSAIDVVSVNIGHYRYKKFQWKP